METVEGFFPFGWLPKLQTSRAIIHTKSRVQMSGSCFQFMLVPTKVQSLLRRKCRFRGARTLSSQMLRPSACKRDSVIIHQSTHLSHKKFFLDHDYMPPNCMGLGCGLNQSSKKGLWNIANNMYTYHHPHPTPSRMTENNFFK